MLALLMSCSAANIWTIHRCHLLYSDNNLFWHFSATITYAVRILTWCVYIYIEQILNEETINIAAFELLCVQANPNRTVAGSASGKNTVTKAKDRKYDELSAVDSRQR